MKPIDMKEIDVNRLEVRHLSTFFDTDEGLVRSVADVSFSIRPGKTTALVGESGSGKSVTSLTLMRLLSRTASTQVSGEALFTNRAGRTMDLLSLPEAEMRRIRGNEIAMIFQEPMTSLNPVFTVGEQIGESVRLHMGLDRTAALAHALRMLELVEIPAAKQRLNEYPHQLSGGMRQRVMIAMALVCEPRLLIADEPTTALDVTIQAQIMDLLLGLADRTGTAIMFITHNLGLVAQSCHRMVTMYAGQVVEGGPVKDVIAGPRHPYTAGLLHSIPDSNRARGTLPSIAGRVPSLRHMPKGCRFGPRCSYSMQPCELPQSIENEGVENIVRREVRCNRWEELELRGVGA